MKTEPVAQHCRVVLRALWTANTQYRSSIRFKYSVRAAPFRNSTSISAFNFVHAQIHMPSCLINAASSAGQVLRRKLLFVSFSASLGGALYSSAFVHFPFSDEGWTEKIHPVVVEQPAEFINRQGLMDVWLAVIPA